MLLILLGNLTKSEKGCGSAVSPILNQTPRDSRASLQSRSRSAHACFLLQLKGRLRQAPTTQWTEDARNMEKDLKHQANVRQGPPNRVMGQLSTLFTSYILITFLPLPHNAPPSRSEIHGFPQKLTSPPKFQGWSTLAGMGWLVSVFQSPMWFRGYISQPSQSELSQLKQNKSQISCWELQGKTTLNCIFCYI